MQGLRRGAGRPRGMPNRRTLAIGGTLDAAHAKVSRALLDEVVPDRHLAQLLWKQALEGDSKVAMYLADRKWGRVKFEMEHEGTTQVIVTVGSLDIPYLPKPRMMEVEGRMLPVIASVPA